MVHFHPLASKFSKSRLGGSNAEDALIFQSQLAFSGTLHGPPSLYPEPQQALNAVKLVHFPDSIRNLSHCNIVIKSAFQDYYVKHLSKRSFTKVKHFINLTTKPFPYLFSTKLLRTCALCILACLSSKIHVSPDFLYCNHAVCEKFTCSFPFACLSPYTKVETNTVLKGNGVYGKAYSSLLHPRK